MTGVEILAVSEIVVDTTFNLMPAIGAFAITFGIFILSGLLLSLFFEDWSNMVITAIGGIIFGVAFGVVTGSCEGIPTEYETRYKVIISDEVSINDFLERYEILDQEGKIYTVRERDGVEGDN